MCVQVFVCGFGYAKFKKKSEDLKRERDSEVGLYGDYWCYTIWKNPNYYFMTF